MMWNYIHGSLLAGATMVLYDGSVAYPDMNTLWKFAQEARIHHFGTSAAYLLANMKEDLHPAKDFDLLSFAQSAQRVAHYHRKHSTGSIAK